MNSSHSNANHPWQRIPHNLTKQDYTCQCILAFLNRLMIGVKNIDILQELKTKQTIG